VLSDRVQVGEKRFALGERVAALQETKRQLEEARKQQTGRSLPVVEGLRAYIERAGSVLSRRVWTRVLELFVVIPVEADVPARGKRPDVTQPPMRVSGHLPRLLARLALTGLALMEAGSRPRCAPPVYSGSESHRTASPPQLWAVYRYASPSWKA
jgi:hypothetical protein